MIHSEPSPPRAHPTPRRSDGFPGAGRIRVAVGLPPPKRFGPQLVEPFKVGREHPRIGGRPPEIPCAATPKRPAHPKIAQRDIANHGLVSDVAKVRPSAAFSDRTLVEAIADHHSRTPNRVRVHRQSSPSRWARAPKDRGVRPPEIPCATTPERPARPKMAQRALSIMDLPPTWPRSTRESASPDGLTSRRAGLSPSTLPRAV